MSKKKTKKRVQENPLVTQAKHERDYIARMKVISDKLVGSGWFEKIPKTDIDIIYEKRYHPIKIQLTPHQTVNEAKWDYYKKGFVLMMNSALTTVNGGQIPMRSMLCEGLALLHFVDTIAGGRFPGSRSLREKFTPFLLSTKQYYNGISDELSFMLFLLDVRNGNYHDGFLLADTSNTNIGKIPLQTNTILVQQYKPIKSSIFIDGQKREVINVSRPTPSRHILQVAIKPSDIGIITDTDEPLKLYIQQHALKRLDERLGLFPDVVHGHMFFTLFNQPLTFVKERDHALITFYMHGIKVGYFLTTLHEDKLLIRSFLFLTNDGTPEGNKLRNLTKLEKIDKKYLGIDKLSTFNAYHIDQDEKLSKLFNEAGCGSLLQAGSLEMISTAYIPNKDTTLLHKYLDGNSYFRN